ncbi:hypothetical protein [Paenibacillus sp. ACRRY]|uniref:hypothetical protein n=1 Tax=Paenibacillus sp. ACRRY TaxID=2918208 RepID=UPI001EF5433F|nr:hypothetical protein [Paenibacillus sp. ACRRY]MCG7381613.1 hypothetical protein [Paenibacillus sp. ACRRY]
MEQDTLEVSFQDEQLEQAIKQLLKRMKMLPLCRKDMKSVTLVDRGEILCAKRSTVY